MSKKSRIRLHDLGLIAVARPLMPLFYKPQWHFLLAVAFYLIGSQAQITSPLVLFSCCEIKLEKIEEPVWP